MILIVEYLLLLEKILFKLFYQEKVKINQCFRIFTGIYEPYGNLTVFTSGKDGIFLPGIPVGKTEMDELDVKVKLFSDPNQLIFCYSSINKY